jgi:putative redox protein
MYGVEISNKGTSQFLVKSKDGELVIDTKGKGVTPPDALLASLGSCIGVYIRKYAEGAKLALNEFTVKVEAEFSAEAPVCFRQIKVTLDLKEARLDERRQKSLMEFIKNCPVHNTLKVAPQVEIALVD